jgi:molybdopterin synthase catalytic subunit
MTDIRVQIITEKIEDFRSPIPKGLTFGSRLEFLGVIRPEEAGETINGIVYEAYEPMAKKVIARILEDLGKRHSLLAADVVHRVNRVPVGEAAIRVRIWSVHREEALEACAEFMNRLKQDVPIWKIATF